MPLLIKKHSSHIHLVFHKRGVVSDEDHSALPDWFNAFQWLYTYTTYGTWNISKFDFVTCHLSSQIFRLKLFPPLKKMRWLLFKDLINWKMFNTLENLRVPLRNFFTAVEIQVVYRQALTAIFKIDPSLARPGLALQDHIEYESIYLQLLIMKSSVIPTQECMKRRDN